MSIDPFAEEVLTLSQAARLLPRRRRDRPVNVATLYRWKVTGCRGIKLETIQIGGATCTSKQALTRFFERLTAATNPSRPVGTPAARRRAIEKAEAELDAAGI